MYVLCIYLYIYIYIESLLLIFIMQLMVIKVMYNMYNYLNMYAYKTQRITYFFLKLGEILKIRNYFLKNKEN
jgi:hypothetical protein